MLSPRLRRFPVPHEVYKNVVPLPRGRTVLPRTAGHERSRKEIRMALAYIHTCYRVLDPEKSEDFYVNKRSRTTTTGPYNKGDGYAHVAFTVDGLEETVRNLKSQGVKVTLEPKTLTADGNDYRIAETFYGRFLTSKSSLTT
jgi:lactoylglutathione lyase